MIRSMTGYGRVQQAAGGFNILLEIKSVNHRFFEFSARMPRLYGFLEDKLKTYLQQYISRGKVDVFLTIDVLDDAGSEIRLNEGLARSYVKALNTLAEEYGLINDLSVSSVARFSDIFTVLKSAEDEDKVWETVKSAADQAITGFMKMREAEGERLRADLNARAERIYELVCQVEQRSPQTVNEYQQKLEARMKEILQDVSVDENRVLMEAAVYADKVSVTEETVRLKSHLKQFGTMLDSDEPVGRKLDFLMQEMNREANTIGSKASDLPIARAVVEIKAELEKIREQIQNIE